MRQTKKLLPLALLFAVAACSQYENDQYLGRDMGNAITHNFSVQIIDPAPNLEGKEVPNMEGTRAAGAVDRYDTGTEITPETIDTTEIN